MSAIGPRTMASGISLSETTVGRELRALGYRKISRVRATSRRTNWPSTLLKKAAVRTGRDPRRPPGRNRDRAVVSRRSSRGQKNSITRRWARRGTRPRAPHDQRTKWAYIFGAICPKKGKGAALVMPWCDTPAMAAHLAEISATVDASAHAVLMLDQCGMAHVRQARRPGQHHPASAAAPISAGVNPVENVWQFTRDTGSRTGSSNPMTTSSPSAATPGTTSSTDHGKSCPSGSGESAHG